MKELFCGFLNVSISCSAVICLILLLRIFLQRGSYRMKCMFWVAVFLRLLFPRDIPSVLSLMPDLSSISGNNLYNVGFSEPVLQESVPDFIPQTPVSFDTGKVAIDYMAILSWVWLIGVTAMVLYMLISYVILRCKLRNATLLENGIYIQKGLDSAILVGYFPAKVYLPANLDAQAAQLVIAHERMHKKRCDHWLKLIAFLCLAAHWYNPFVWIAYILLCRDMEAACDEQVAMNLDVEQKKAYCAALLACGKSGKGTSACPVAFGEISVHQRIRNILSGKKPITWVSVAALAAVAFVFVFLLTNPLPGKKLPTYYEELEGLIGQPVETVCEALGITQQQLGQEIPPGIYQPALKAEYLGVEFDVVLMFSVDTQKLGAFRYVASYEGITQAAAEDAAKIARQLWENYGKGYQWELKDDPAQFRNITGEEVFAIHQNVYNRTGTFTIRDLWNLTDDAPSNVKAFLQQMELSELWQNSYGELSQRYGVKPACYLEFFTDVSKTEEATMLVLEYRTGWIPGRYSTMTIEN